MDDNGKHSDSQLSGGGFAVCALARPLRGNSPPSRQIIDHQNQLMIVIAVEDFDVDSSLGHPAAEQTELPRHSLPQSLHHNLPLGEHRDAG